MRANEFRRNTVVDLRSETGQALARSAVWIFAAYAGASTLAIGLLRLVHGESSALSALAFVLAGGVVAAFAWRRGYRIIDRIDAPPTAASAAQGRLPADRSTSGLTTLVGAPEA